MVATQQSISKQIRRPIRRSKTLSFLRQWKYVIATVIALVGIVVVRLLPRQLPLNGKSEEEEDKHGLAKWVSEIIPPFGSVLKSIAIERTPGTDGHALVQSYISSELQIAGWTVELDHFEHNGVPMANIIARRPSNSSSIAERKRVILAAHYDTLSISQVNSEESENDNGDMKKSFVGAMDAAWSCSLLLQLAKNTLKDMDPETMAFDVELVFFDGEEAFSSADGAEASADNSLLGSRHLAQRWKETSSLDDIHLFVLLDLLGSSNPIIYSSFPETLEYHEQLAAIEHMLEATVTKRTPVSTVDENGELIPTDQLVVGEDQYVPIFNRERQLQGVQVIPSETDGEETTTFAIMDDHVPFAMLNVPVLHLIPFPFPSTWHTIKDDVMHLDPGVCSRLATIMHFFISNLLLGSTE